MYEIAVCDDDERFSGEFRAMLVRALEERGAECRVTLYPDPVRLMAALQRGEICDLLFLDIVFGQEKGIRFARMLRERKWDAELVFVTSSPEYAVMGYDARPLHFLLKPVTPEKLAEVLNRFLEQRTPQILQLPTGQGLLRIPTQDILYCESYSHTIAIYLAGGESKIWRGSLNELEAALPPSDFVRTHRSYVVNLAHIAEIDRTQVRFPSGEMVPVSKSAYPNVLTSMIAYDRRKNRAG